jgi:superfamily II DNA/RNA helicase
VLLTIFSLFHFLRRLSGSGKTLAYILPLFERLLRTQESNEEEQDDDDASSEDEEARNSQAVGNYQDDRLNEEGGGDYGNNGETAAEQTPKKRISLESFPRAVVLVPNRELVQQILSMAGPSAGACGLKLGASPKSAAAPGSPWPFVLGGRREAPDVLVCTPAFAAHHTKAASGALGVALFRHLETIVFDEVGVY